MYNEKEEVKEEKEEKKSKQAEKKTEKFVDSSEVIRSIDDYWNNKDNKNKIVNFCKSIGQNHETITNEQKFNFIKMIEGN